MKLQVKVPLLVVAIMLAVGIVMGALMLLQLRRVSTDQLEQTALTLARLVQSTLEIDMVESRLDHLQSHVADIRNHPMVNEVVIFSSTGKIIASSEGTEIGATRDDGVIRAVLETGTGVTRSEDRYGRSEFCAIVPIYLKPECVRCHGSQQKILGAVEVGLKTSVRDDLLSEQSTLMVVLGALTFCLVGGAVTYGLRRMILNPLTRLGQSAHKISEGDYSTRVEVHGDDEVGSLARSFNGMAQQVEDRAREQKEWNVGLENSVRQRTKELSALNAVIAAASKSLDLDETLVSALDKVMAVMEMDAGAVHLLGGGANPPVLVQKGMSAECCEELERMEISQCPAGRAVLEGKYSAQSDTLASDGVIVRIPEASDYRTYVSVPISSKGKVLGALCLFSSGVREFHPEEIHLLTAMGDGIGVGVEHAQVARRLRLANEELTQLLARAMEGGFDVAFDNPHLVQCWAERNCQKTDCPAYQSQNLRCWQVAGTFCGGCVQGEFAEKLDSCSQCEIFRKSCGRDEITAIGESFNNMMFLLKLEAKRREELRQQLIEKLIAAQEDERKRVARELHDQTSQSLTSLIVGLKTLESASTPQKFKEGAAELQNLALLALDEVHRLSLELRPAALDDLGLVAALRSYLRETSQRFKVGVDFQTAGLKGRLPSTVETALYRIVQEAVTNVLKHAEARTIKVSLEQTDSAVFATVKDDGKGFKVDIFKDSATQGKGLGLAGMWERATLLGGKLTVESEPGRGARLSVEIPLPATGETDG